MVLQSLMLRCFTFAILVFLDVEQFLELDSSCSRQPKGNDKDRDFGQKHVVCECWDLSHTLTPSSMSISVVFPSAAGQTATQHAATHVSRGLA